MKHIYTIISMSVLVLAGANSNAMDEQLQQSFQAHINCFINQKKLNIFDCAFPDLTAQVGCVVDLNLSNAQESEREYMYILYNQVRKREQLKNTLIASQDRFDNIFAQLPEEKRKMYIGLVDLITKDT